MLSLQNPFPLVLLCWDLQVWSQSGNELPHLLTSSEHLPPPIVNSTALPQQFVKTNNIINEGKNYNEISLHL